MNVSYSIKGPLFSKRATDVVQKAIVSQVLDKTSERVSRPGRKLGRRNNTIRSQKSVLILDLTSSLRDRSNRREAIPSFGRGAGRRKNPDFNPRAKGTSWVKFVFSLVNGSFGRNQMKAAAKQIIGDLN